jgi:hypothetical protein
MSQHARVRLNGRQCCACAHGACVVVTRGTEHEWTCNNTPWKALKVGDYRCGAHVAVTPPRLCHLLDTSCRPRSPCHQGSAPGLG